MAYRILLRHSIFEYEKAYENAEYIRIFENSRL